MKKYILTTVILVISLIGFSQVSPVGHFRILNEATAFGINLPVGTEIFVTSDSSLWKVTKPLASTASISTAGATFISLIGRGTNLSVGTKTSTTVDVNSSTGTAVTLPSADGTNAGLMTAAEYTNLSHQSGTNTGDQTITLTGDVTGSGTGSFATVVGKINGTSLAGLGTGILKNTTGTGVPSIAVAGDFPTLNQSTTGNATTATTATNLAGGSGGTIPYQSAAGTTAMLANGTVGQVLTSAGTTLAPTWTTPTTGTVTSVTSADGNATVATTTTTPVITIVSAPKLTTARTIAITGDMAYTSPSFDGTGNVTAAGTLATVNGNVGSFGSSTSIPSFTVNAKGLITAASGNAVIAPAGTLSGTVLNSTVVTSSLTSVGTITSGTWNGTAIGIGNGGTGQTTKAAAFDALSPMTTGGDLVFGGTSGTGTRLANGTAGQVLTSGGTTAAPTWSTPTTGTVTSVSVTTANGVSGVVATATTTPAITLTLGAITPTSVNGVTLSGSSTPTLAVTGTTTVSGSNTGDVTLAGQNYLSISGQVITANAVNLSGTNVTGTLAAARFPALTGDVTTTAGALGTTIANNAVTYAKMQAMTTQTLIGSGASGTAAEEITLGTGLSFSGTVLNTTGVGSRYKVESFEEATGGTGITYTLANTPNTVTTGLTVQLNGMPLIASATAGYTNTATSVVIHIPVYIYDKLTVSYTY